LTTGNHYSLAQGLFSQPRYSEKMMQSLFNFCPITSFSVKREKFKKAKAKFGKFERLDK